MVAIPLCVYDKYYNVSTVKHTSCILYYYAKMYLQEQHVSTQLRGHHQVRIVMKLKMAIQKLFKYCHFQFHYYTSLMMDP
jgi:hypothetical protein